MKIKQQILHQKGSGCPAFSFSFLGLKIEADIYFASLEERQEVFVIILSCFLKSVTVRNGNYVVSYYLNTRLAIIELIYLLLKHLWS